MAEPIDFPITQSRLLYVYSIDDQKHKGLLKVGEVFTDNTTADNADAQELSKAVRKILDGRSYMKGVIYHLEFVESTTYDNECYTAQDIYDVLVNSGVEAVALAKYKTVAGTQDADIWFRTDLDRIRRAIRAKKEGHLTFNGTDDHVRPRSIRFRPEQEKAIAETVKHFQTKKGFECLWNAKMRFGKTLSALEVARRMDYKSVLIVTHRPVVDKGWKDDFGKIFGSDSRYKYAERNLDDNSGTHKYDLDNFRTDTGLVASGTIRLVFFVSLQYLRLSTLVGGKDTSNLKKEIMQYDWDMVIVDEAHEGTESTMGSRVLDKLNKAGSTHVLSLSGTPFNLLDKFEADKDRSKIYTWDYVMEQTAKNEWDDRHYGDPNPYAVLPKMQIMTFTLSQLLSEQVQGKGKFSFKEFFRVWTGDPKADHAPMPEGMQNRFVHEDAVNAFIRKLYEKSDTTAYPFSTVAFRRNFRHTFWMLPGVKAAAALEKLLEADPVFGTDKNGKRKFEIVNVAGDGNIEDVGGKALKAVQDAIHDHNRTITLSCGKLTTGVTVPEWTAVLCMKGAEDTAAGGYMQTIFRVQSHAVIEGRQKRNCYVFDFAPDRALTAVAAASKYATIAAGEGKGNLKESRKKEEEHLSDFLRLCSVVSMDGATMGRKFTAARLFEKLNTVYIERAVKSGYSDNSLYDPEVLMNLNEEQKKALGDVHGLLGSMPNLWKPEKIDITKSGMSDEEKEKADAAAKKKKEGRQLTEEDKAALAAREAERNEERARESVLRGVAIRIPLLVYGAEMDDDQDITIDNFTDLFRNDPESWEEFMPKGFTMELFNILKDCFDRTIFTGAAKRIRAMVREADDLDIEDRINKIADIFACFHNPDKETVLTPWRVVNMQLSDTLGGYCFYNEQFDGPNYSTDPVTQEEKRVPRLVLRPADGDDAGSVTHDVFGDYNTRIMEINSKTGLYPLYCAYSVFRMIKEKAYIGSGLTTERKGIAVTREQYDRYANDDKAIWEDVLQDNIFVVCRTPMAASITRRTLGGFMKDIHMNVVCYRKALPVDALTKAGIIKDKTAYTEKGITTKECDLIDVLRLNPDIFRNEVVRGNDFWHVYSAISLAPNEDINNMKFKAIVGNPPYQESKASELTKSNAAFASAIYPYFIDACLKIEPAYISLITPSRWMTRVGQGISDEWVTKMLSSNQFICMHDFINATDCFDNVEIKGGVNYFLISKDYKGKCQYMLHQKGNVFANKINLDSIGAGVVIRDANAINIIEKVSKVEGHYFNNKSFSMLVSPKHYFDKGELLSSNWMGYSKVKDTNHPIKFYVNRRLEPEGYGWINESDIPRNKQTLSLNKVFIPKAGGSGSDSIILGTPFYGEPNSVCSYTYLVIAYEQKEHIFTQKECFNIISYIKTCFFRYMVSIKKKTQDNPRDVFQFVPLQDFTSSSDIDWTQSVADIDRQLYRKYGLSDEEVAFIEKMIKPME